MARRLLPEAPREIVLLSLRREEAEEAVAALSPESQGVRLHAAWGDVFTFADLKDRPRREVYGDHTQRRRLIESLVEPLSEGVAAQYFLHQLITERRPDIIIDAVNTATGIAYQGVYKTSRHAYQRVGLSSVAPGWYRLLSTRSGRTGVTCSYRTGHRSGST